MNTEPFLRLQEKQNKTKKAYLLWKKMEATQEDNKEVQRICREKIRKAKVQLELYLATGVKDNTTLLQILTLRRGPRRISLNAAGNVATEDKEKAEVLNASSHLSLKVRSITFRVLYS